MQPEQPSIDQVKQRMRATWVAGDFGQIAQYSAKYAEEFVARLAIKPGTKVLDVACGTGNLSIPAARAGAIVTGVDIAPNLLEQARRRAADEKLTATFDEGDAEQLPYADGQFDLVMTMFGAMFAPRPDRTASELLRVCRPGGTIAMANWTPTGFVATMFATGARFAPPPPGIPSPLQWGDDAVVKQRFANGVSSIQTVVRAIDMAFPFPPKDVVQFFRDYFGPTNTTFARLDPPQQLQYAAELEKHFQTNNRDQGGGTSVVGTYLEVIATRA